MPPVKKTHPLFVPKPAPRDATFDVNPKVEHPLAETAFETFLLKVKALADKIQALTAAGPGKASQAQLDALHADAQRLLTVKVKAPQK